MGRRPVRVIRLVAVGTVEEQILACADRKLRLDKAVSTGDVAEGGSRARARERVGWGARTHRALTAASSSVFGATARPAEVTTSVLLEALRATPAASATELGRSE